MNCPHCGSNLMHCTLPNMEEYHCTFYLCEWSGNADELEEEE